jgi:hypothetical protein
MKVHLGHTEQNKCQAYTHKHRKCRLEVSDGERVCSIHKSYFKNWFINHPPLEEKEFEEGKRRKQAEFLDFFRKGCPGGHTIHDIMRYTQRIPSTSNYATFYLWLSEHFYISPLWNMEQFVFMTTEFVRIVYRDKEFTDIPALYNHMDIVYASPKCIEHGWTTLLMTIITYIYNNTSSVSFQDKDYVEGNMQCISILLGWPGWQTLVKSTLLSSTDETIREKEKNAFIEWVYEELIIPSVETQKNIWIGLTQSRCDIIKEGLMAELWSPSRMQRCLDMGQDLDDL